MRQEIVRVIALFILSTNSYTDVRRHEISPFLTAGGGIAGIAIWFMGSGQEIPLPASMLAPVMGTSALSSTSFRRKTRTETDTMTTLIA